MSFLIELNEGISGRRVVPFRLFNSDGTGPVTGASNGTMLGSLNGAAQLSLGSMSVVSANAGMYSFTFSQSNVSVLGSWALWTDTIATAFPQHVATAQVVNFNPFSSQSNVVNATIANGTYSAVTVRIEGVSYSGLTIQGVSNISASKDVVSDITGGVWYVGNRSGVSVEVKTGGIQTNSIGAGSYSGVSVEVKTGGIQTASVGVGNYSGVSVEIKSGGIQTGSYGAGSYSGVTFDGAKFLSAAGERSVASSLLSTNLGNNRFIQQGFEALRNRVQISGSTGTVYQTDDTTSSWTFSITTVASQAISQLDPGGL